MFRCPTCIGVLPDPRARRCPTCRQRLTRRRPLVLGEDNRLGARPLPVDRALLARLAARGTPAAAAASHPGEPHPPAGTSVEREPLDPSVQALIDELYARARAELAMEAAAAARPRQEPAAAGPRVRQEPAAAPARRGGWVPAILAHRPGPTGDRAGRDRADPHTGGTSRPTHRSA